MEYDTENNTKNENNIENENNPGGKKKIVAIIPARGGSKSIPKKNVKVMGEKPLIAYPIHLAKSIKDIDRVIVSTDSEEIAEVAKKYGAEVPFIRPAELSQDDTPTLPVLQHGVKYLEENDNFKADYVILLYPTSPFLKVERIQEAIDLLKTGKHHSVIGVVKDWGRYWILDEEKNDYTILYPKKRVNRQYYKPLYKEDGAIYFSDYDTIITQNKLVDDSNPGFVVVGEDERCDIDTPEDWKRAERFLETKGNLTRDDNKKMNTISIKTPKGEREIGPGHPTFIIAEMSGNHNQSYERAIQIIDKAIEAGVDAIKLQTYTADTLTIDCDKEPFQVKVNDDWKGNSLYSLYQKGNTPWEWHSKLKDYAESKGVMLFSTPFDVTAVDFLETLNMQLYKVASFETGHIPLLKRIGRTKKPVIVSRGMTSIEDLELAIKTLKDAGAPEVVVLHCISSYPATPNQMNLKTIPDIEKRFNVMAGLSDHSLGITAPISAVTLGASVIEKHFTLSRAEGGPDASFSLEPHELKQMVKCIREAEVALGEPTYSVKEREAENLVFKQSIMVVKDMKRGDIFTEDNIRIIRPGYGLPPKHFEETLGKIAKENLERGTPLTWEAVE